MWPQYSPVIGWWPQYSPLIGQVATSASSASSPGSSSTTSPPESSSNHDSDSDHIVDRYISDLIRTESVLARQGLVNVEPIYEHSLSFNSLLVCCSCWLSALSFLSGNFGGKICGTIMMFMITDGATVANYFLLVLTEKQQLAAYLLHYFIILQE